MECRRRPGLAMRKTRRRWTGCILRHRTTIQSSGASSTRVWDTYEAILDACQDAWNKLMQSPERIASLTIRLWAPGLRGGSDSSNAIAPRPTLGHLGHNPSRRIACWVADRIPELTATGRG